MKLLRSSAAQSGLFSRLFFLAGATFIFLLLTITPSHAEDVPTESPSTSTESGVSPTPSEEPTPSPSQPESTTPTEDSSPSSDQNLPQEPSEESLSSPSTEPSPESTPQQDPVETQLLTTMSDSPSVNSSTPAVTEIVTAAGDDSSYQIPLTVPIMFNGVQYTDVYATTNSVITFGQPDGTYWDYPMTPSISLQSRDWWAYPTWMPDTWFIIRVSDGGFQVDGAYRPFGVSTGEVTNIVITAQILTTGDVNYTYTVDGPLAGFERIGARLQDGTVVPLDQIGITETEEPAILDDTPVDPGDSTDNSGDSQENSSDSSGEGTQNQEDNQTPPNDTPSNNPDVPERPEYTPPTSDNPSEDTDSSTETEPEPTQPEDPQEPTDPEESDGIDESEDEPQSEESSEQEQDTQEQDNQSQETSPEPTTTEEAVNSLLEEFGDEAVTVAALVEAGLSFSDLPPDTPVDVRTDENGNPVIITAEVAAALQLLESPAALIDGIFNCVLPSDTTEQLTEEQKCQVLAALANIGADMSPQEREEAQKMVIATVIAAGAAMNAVAAAGGATGGSSRGGGSSGGGAPTGDMKAVRRRRK